MFSTTFLFLLLWQFNQKFHFFIYTLTNLFDFSFLFFQSNYSSGIFFTSVSLFSHILHLQFSIIFVILYYYDTHYNEDEVDRSSIKI